MGFENSTDIQSYLNESEGEEFVGEISHLYESDTLQKNYQNLFKILGTLLSDFANLKVNNSKKNRKAVFDSIDNLLTRYNPDKEIPIIMVELTENNENKYADYLRNVVEILKDIKHSILKEA